MSRILDRGAADLERENTELRRQLDACRAELNEARAQQTATAEVLQVVNDSPGDLQPVFDATLEKATRLCEAALGVLFIRDGELFRAAATLGLPAPLEDFLRNPFKPDQMPLIAGVIQRGQVLHVHDAADTDGYHERLPSRVAGVDLGGVRTVLYVPLIKDGRVLGVFVILRQEVRPFSDNQIALLQNFAAQAVIAIENARLLGELRERTRDLEQSLEYQTAISDVLKVISGAAFDLAPVLQTVVTTAIRLCRADQAVLYRNVGGEYRWAAGASLVPEYERIEREVRIRPGAGTLVGRAALDARTVHILDAWTDPLYEAKADAQVGGIHTMLGVPLLRDGEPIGVIGLARQRVEAYAENEIELVRTFADQAVIAIENARLITETREALEQQTATAEVLQVINSSPGDLAPVFDAILEKAMRLCGVEYGDLELYDGTNFRAVATYGLSDAFAEQVRRGYPGADNPATRPLIAGERLTHIADLSAADFSKVFKEDPVADEAHQTLLCVPLRRDGRLLGMIASARKEVRPFSEKEIALLENFAAQAVIAIENARLLTELHESLEQQQAIAEVLQVINSSPGDLAPVFDAMVDRARRLCEADSGHLALPVGDDYRTAAVSAMSPEMAAMVRAQSYASGRGTAVGRALLQRQTVQIADIGADFEHAAPHASSMGLIRTVIGVPLLREGEPVGAFGLTRREARPFTERQIELVRTFAAQAVIAIDNARLLDEIRQRQAELRVTFDNMGDGVAMFDGELRLAAWNRNFQQILGLSEEFVTARPSSEEYIRYLAAHGEYGAVDVETEVRRLTETLGTQWSAARTRPDGRVIEVRHNPVPGGGFVLIYSDITERKRAEAELRTARDAAETALAELKTAQASLVHAEKMASLGQLTAGIAHEIKNPLNFVNNFAGLSVELLDELKEAAAPALAVLDGERRAEAEDLVATLTGNLEKIAEHGRRADGIVKSMLDHSRGGSGERQSVDLNALVDEALSLAYHGARAQDQSFNIMLERDFDRDIAPIELIPQDVTRVLLNLFSNGFYATSKRRGEVNDGEFEPRLKVTTRDLGTGVEIRVRDNGAGIPPEIKDKLFQPFFTTKPTGEGTGLGLSISYDIVTQEHGGSIAVDSQLGEFTEFAIRLPRRAAIRAGEPPPPPPPADRPAPRLL